MKMTNEERKQTWVVGVSGGGDSMALLQMCIAEGIHVIVAHMNYQKRSSAKRDEEGVVAFCKAHSILVEVRKQEEQCIGNFQAFARLKRYQFYQELIQRYHCAGVLVAHQLDDHLETYLMQQKRKMIPQYYGLCDHVELYGCHVVRPLLAYTKAELEEYCKDNGVPYWLDESNLSNDYTRNQIRHEQIERMSLAQKHTLAKEIQVRNEQLHQRRQAIQTFLATWDHQCASLLAQEDAPLILHTWIQKTCGHAISHKEELTLIQMIKQANNWTRTINCSYDIRKEYGNLQLIEKAEGFTYSYPRLCYETTPYFTICDHGARIESITLTSKDFPITIRSYQPGDYIQMRFGKKKLNRWFIDRKIPLQERKLWPVVVNAAGKIVFVPKIGCDIAHFSNNPNAFVIK